LKKRNKNGATSLRDGKFNQVDFRSKKVDYCSDGAKKAENKEAEGLIQPFGAQLATSKGAQPSASVAPGVYLFGK
jgi:hypothetical protein